MKLALGTVQFGLAYGAFNQGGQVAPTEVGSILALAASRGVDLLDTAHAYGESETVLGMLPEAGTFRVVTKIPALGEDAPLAQLEDAFRTSLARLRREGVHGLMMHRAGDLLGAQGDARWAALERFVAAGLVERIGFSAYGPEEALAVLRRYPVRLVQLPMSVFDRRHARAGVLELCRERGIEVQARSVLLQGFAVAEPTALRGHLAQWREVLQRFRVRCDDLRVSPLAAAIGFVHAQAEVDHLVLGVDSVAHMREILDALSQCECAAGEFAGVACDEPSLVDPSTWA
jgi:aryl-alcohol dehydrogenase-like predicted oxidoreductase